MCLLKICYYSAGHFLMIMPDRETVYHFIKVPYSKPKECRPWNGENVCLSVCQSFQFQGLTLKAGKRRWRDARLRTIEDRGVSFQSTYVRQIRLSVPRTYVLYTQTETHDQKKKMSNYVRTIFILIFFPIETEPNVKLYEIRGWHSNNGKDPFLNWVPIFCFL